MRFVPWMLAIAGCSGGEPATDTNPTDGSPTPVFEPGTLALTFRIDTDYQAAMDEEALGTFYGSIFVADEVDSLGPMDGAVALEDLQLEVDLRADGGPTDVLHTTSPLDIERVAILGFLDSDGNADVNGPDPDAKDPVTLPNDNKFTVPSGGEATVEVFFGLLNP